MSAPYTLSGNVTFSPDIGAPAAPMSLSGSGQFTSLSDGFLSVTGSGSKSIPLGTIPAAGAKAVLIKVDASATGAPIQVKVNGSVTGTIEVAPGGSLLIHNPSPVTGITSLDITYTSSNLVRFWVLGD